MPPTNLSLTTSRRRKFGRTAFLHTIFLCALAPLAAALETKQWKHRQPLTLDRAGIAKIALPPSTLDLAQPNLEDLRLIDGAGREVPYSLERAAPAAPPSVRRPKAFRVELAESTTRLEIETGHDAPLAAATLVTPAPHFLKAVRVEISPDGERWDVVHPGAPVFRQFGAEQLRLELPGRPAARVRITIDDTRSRPVPITGATLAFVATTQPPLTTPLPVRIANREEFAGETVLTLDLGARHVPLAAIEFVSAEPLFMRKVTVAVRELRDDAAAERPLASGAIFRVAADGLAPTAELTLPLELTAPSRELLVHIANHDSPPIAIDEVRAQQRPIWLVFRAAEPGSYTLLTGNPDAAAPRYDLAALASTLRAAAPSPLSFGEPELNPGYRRADALADTPLLGATLDPTPWRYRKTVRLAAGGVQQLELDVDVLSRAQANLGDLRLVRERTQIPYLLERPSLSRTVPLVIAARADPKRPQLSRWELALPRPGFPVTHLTLTSSHGLFQRHLRVSEKVSDERSGGYERQLGEASWSKTPGHAPALTLSLMATPLTDTLLLETDNGDNPPIALEKAQAHYAVARLLFKVDASTPAMAESPSLALYYGNAQAGAPRYDVQLVAHHILAAEKHVAVLDSEEKARADGWAASALAKARGGPLFWGALALVVVVLLVVVSKLLPKPPESAV